MLDDSKTSLIRSLDDAPIVPKIKGIGDALKFDRVKDRLFELMPKRPGIFVELGAQHGVLSARACHYLHKETKIYSVDLWSNDAESTRNYDAGSMNLRSWALNVRDYLGTKIVGIREDTVRASSRFKDSSIDLCFVDADHMADAVYRDSVAWWPKLKPGGWLVGHDIAGRWEDEVEKGLCKFASYIKREYAISQLYGTEIPIQRDRRIQQCWSIQK